VLKLAALSASWEGWMLSFGPECGMKPGHFLNRKNVKGWPFCVEQDCYNKVTVILCVFDLKFASLTEGHAVGAAFI
jgi:hypothetical protein